MTLIWVHQTNQPGLGDFVRICPTILTLSLKIKSPVPVYFQNKEIEKIFENCSFIEILKSIPKNKHLFNTGIILNKNIRYGKIINRYYGSHYKIHGNENMLPVEIPISPISEIQIPNAVAVFNGIGLPEFYPYGKNITNEVRTYIIQSLLKNNYKPIILGTYQDKERFWKEIDLEGCVDLLGKTKLNEAVDIISGCQFFVSNDTCLYHFSSILKKKGIVFWRETSHSLDGNPFDTDYIFHFKNEDPNQYYKAFDYFLEKFSSRI